MTDLIKRAESFARSRHLGQFRKGDAQEPYIIHVEEVAQLVNAWGGSENAIAAAWLHDTVEDCPPTSFDEIAQEFG
jgi:(p)ppGpp synthase/HD superfamily hydrolase